MSPPTTRKPPRLVNDDAPSEEQPWRVRLADGQVRGPLSVAGLRSFVEVGILTHKEWISLVAEDKWELISGHPLWKELQPASRQFSFRDAELVEKVVVPHVSPADVAIHPEKLVRMEAGRQAALAKIARGLAFWEVSRALRALREGVVFLAFIAFGDLATSFFDHSLGLIKAGVLLCLTAVALMYYSFRAMGK